MSRSPAMDAAAMRALDSLIAATTFEQIGQEDVTPRATAVDVYTRGGLSLALATVEPTIEGDPIRSYLLVDSGRARLIRDVRSDRFRDRTWPGLYLLYLDSLALVYRDETEAGDPRWVPLAAADTPQVRGHRLWVSGRIVRHRVTGSTLF